MEQPTSWYSHLPSEQTRFYLWALVGMVVGYACCAVMVIGGLKIEGLDDRFYVALIFIPVRPFLPDPIPGSWFSRAS